MYVGDQVNQKAPSVINILISSVFGGGAVPGGEIQYAYIGSGNYFVNMNVADPNMDK